MKTHNSIVVVSDIRVIPLFSALILRNDNSDLVASERIFVNNDYGDYFPKIYRYIIKILLRYFSGLIIIKANKETRLSKPEKLGLMSSLFSMTNDSGANENKYPKEYQWSYANSLGAKEVADFIQSQNYKIIYLFNGRTASSYNISRLKINNNIKIFYYEFSDSIQEFKLYPNPPHASYANGKLLTDFRCNIALSYNNISDLGRLYRLKKLNNNFTKNYFHKSSINYDVVIFLGSDHEYTAVDIDICGLEWFGNDDFCKRVVNKYGKNIKYAIRCHPNSSIDLNWNNQYSKLDETLKSLNIDYDLFGPDSEINSYSLLGENTIAAIEFSSISIDALLMGKKVDIFADIDTKFIIDFYKNNNFSDKSQRDFISEIFALNEFFLVKKFNKFIMPFLYFFIKIEILIFYLEKK